MDAPRFVYVGYVDEHAVLHELRVTEDAVAAAVARGWMALDGSVCAAPVRPRHEPEESNDDSA